MKSMIHLSLVFCICLSVVSCSHPTDLPDSLSTESSSTVSSLSSTDTSSGTTSTDTVRYVNVEITSLGSVSSFCENSTDSKFVGYVDEGEVYEILRQEVDGRGNLWYQIEMYVNTTVWVLAADCRTTDKPITSTARSAPGQLLNPAIDKDLLLKLLEIHDGKVEDFIRILGGGFTKTDIEYETYDDTDVYTETLYEYPDGIEFQCDEMSDVEYFVIGGNWYYPKNSLKLSGDITSDPGDEILYYSHVDSHAELLVIKSDLSTVIGNYRFIYNGNERFLIGDFCGIGSNQVFYGQENDSYIYKFVYPNLSMLFTIGPDGELTTMLDYQALSTRLQDVKASIDDKNLSLDINVDEYEFSQTRRLPDRIFLNSRNFPDKSEQLTSVIEWNVDSVDSKWYIIVDCIVAFDMFDGYNGLPEMYGDFHSLFNDLARTRLVYDFLDGRLVFRDGDTVVKYPDSSQADSTIVGYPDLVLSNGLTLGQKMEEAFKLLPDAPVSYFDYEYKKTAEGVTMIADNFDTDSPVITNIIVTSPKYPTARGIRVGDTVEKVESLYGKPDMGLPGDEVARYFNNYEFEGNVLTTDFESIIFNYKNGKVSSYQFYQLRVFP